MDITMLSIAAGVTPVHEMRDVGKLDTLVQRMTTDGWQGRPVLAIPNGDGWQLLTGSHRYAAAQVAGLATIPALCVPDAALDADGWDVLEQAMRVGDDDSKLDALRELGLDDAADLMQLEVDANAAED